MLEGPHEALFEEFAELTVLNSPVLGRLGEPDHKVYVCGFILEDLLEHGVEDAFEFNYGAKTRISRIVQAKRLLGRKAISGLKLTRHKSQDGLSVRQQLFLDDPLRPDVLLKHRILHSRLSLFLFI